MPAYRKQVVTFLDIMGFRDIVRKRDCDAITHMLDLIQSSAAVPGESQKTAVISFSDSVVRARPCGTDVVSALLHEVQALATAQWDLMGHGILVRGGLTIGNVLMTTDRAFGPAFVRAYEIESSWAKSPRMVVDPTSVRLIREQARAANGLTARRKLIGSVRKILRLDQDGLWFVDYITSARARLDEDTHRSTMMRHRENIIAEANALGDSSPVLAKYLWLIRYFNGSAKRLHPTVAGLKIRPSDVPLSDELLLPAILRPKKKAG